MAQNKESVAFIFKVAIILSLVCATLVSVAAVALKPIQDRNAAREKKRNILMAAGIYDKAGNIEDTFSERIESRLINLSSGEYIEGDTAAFDMLIASRSDSTGRALTAEEDVAGIKRMPNDMVIYLQKGSNGEVENLILPIYGYGLWGTMYGFLATDLSGETIKGITFYDHKETPGLGGEITNPKWQATWDGKKPYDNGNTVLRLVKTMSSSEAARVHEVDALAGATLTSKGVENTIHFWLSENGYKPFFTQQAKR